MKLIVAIALSLVVAGCGAQSPIASPSAEPTVAATQGYEPSAVPPMDASPLEGTWRTEPVTQADAEHTLRAAGLHEWLQPFRALAAADDISDGPSVLVLSIQDGNWDLDIVPVDGTAVPIDYGHKYEIDGNTVTVKLVSAGEGKFNRYRWTVENDVLRLEWVATNMAPYEGVPEEVMQRAFYMTSPFKRDP